MISRMTLSPLVLALLASCDDAPSDKVPVPGKQGMLKTAAIARADRRAFDGAPPVIPHRSFGAACASCHTRDGLEVPEFGFAPPSPHEQTQGMGTLLRCEQCHVSRLVTTVFVESGFEGLAQDLRKGKRLSQHSPPTLPHATLMRENCSACHSGPAAREEIRCSHPERVRCRQCHVPVASSGEFVPAHVLAVH